MLVNPVPPRMIETWEKVPFNTLTDKIIIKVDGLVVESTCITLTMKNGVTYRIIHHSECCELVYLQDICGDINDILHHRIVSAVEASSEAIPDGDDDSSSWTFYRIATNFGTTLVLRWYGSSNGCYSETADLEILVKREPYIPNHERYLQ